MRNLHKLGALLALSLTAIACHRTTDISQVPVGSEVQVTRQDGALVEGRLAETDARQVKVDTGRTTRVVDTAEIADVRVVTDTLEAEPPQRATFREVRVDADTRLEIALDQRVSSETSHVEQEVTGTITAPVMIDGETVIPKGSAVSGVVSKAEPAGKVKGRASLALHFTQLSIGGERYDIDAAFARTAASEAKSDAAKIGVPAAGGAIIGGILGGKKGAAIGAAAGGGAGAAVVLTSAGDPVVLGEAAVLTLAIGRAIDVRVPLR